MFSPSPPLRRVPVPTIWRRDRRAIAAVVALRVVVHVGCGPAAVRTTRVLARTGAAVVPAESTHRACHAAILDLVLEFGGRTARPAPPSRDVPGSRPQVPEWQKTPLHQWGAPRARLAQRGRHVVAGNRTVPARQNMRGPAPWTRPRTTSSHGRSARPPVLEPRPLLRRGHLHSRPADPSCARRRGCRRGRPARLGHRRRAVYLGDSAVGAGSPSPAACPPPASRLAVPRLHHLPGTPGTVCIDRIAIPGSLPKNTRLSLALSGRELPQVGHEQLREQRVAGVIRVVLRIGVDVLSPRCIGANPSLLNR